MSLTGMVHAPRLQKSFATNFSSLDDFFEDAERGTLPTYAFIEPSLVHAHNDYHPAVGALFPGVSADLPSSILGGKSCSVGSTRPCGRRRRWRARTSPTRC
jgi:phospholipase C